jgi:hypothetical protein
LSQHREQGLPLSRYPVVREDQARLVHVGSGCQGRRSSPRPRESLRIVAAARTEIVASRVAGRQTAMLAPPEGRSRSSERLPQACIRLTDCLVDRGLLRRVKPERDCAHPERVPIGEGMTQVAKAVEHDGGS